MSDKLLMAGKYVAIVRCGRRHSGSHLLLWTHLNFYQCAHCGQCHAEDEVKRAQDKALDGALPYRLGAADLIC